MLYLHCLLKHNENLIRRFDNEKIKYFYARLQVYDVTIYLSDQSPVITD